MPVDYIMQGMIADTGNEWRLYRRHVTIIRFLDWILHPFSHLSGRHSVLNHGSHDMDKGVVRRLVFFKGLRWDNQWRC